MRNHDEPSRLRSTSQRQGFTIIELLMVVVVVGILTAIVMPKFKISAETEVQLAAMQLAQDIDLARTRALTTRSQSRVTFSSSAREYSGYLDEDDDGTIGQTAAERLALRGFDTRPLPIRISFGRGTAPSAPDDAGAGAITFANARVDFDARGLTWPMGSGGTVYLEHEVTKSAVAAIVVSPSGSVRLWSWRNGAWQ